ncbi:hypothetical protein GCM10008983_02620 [Lentibacillus halophilus]|uniref:DUF2953 domain-containing protein n=1 Tax=Lentibacillus halophilus TaxID=295065 RepID=A0ABN0Z399_9BACI
MVIGLIIAIIISGIVFLLCSRLKAVCTVTLNQEEQILYIAVYFYRIRLFYRSVDLMEEPAEEQSFQETLSLLHQLGHGARQKWNHLRTIILFVLKHIRVDNVSWTTEAGTGKADTTGTITGGIWAIKGMVMGPIMTNGTFVHKPSVTVTPFFQQQTFSSVFHCMISIRAGQAMYVFWRVIRKFPVKREAMT